MTRRTRLANAANNLAVILDHVGDGVTVQDASGRLVYANAPAARTLGFATPEELLATPVTEVIGRFSVFDADGRPFPLDQLPGRRALAGEAEPAVTVRFRILATGDERWSTIRASPVVDDRGQVIFAVNVWQDATARKQAEIAQQFLVEAGEALAASLDVEATLVNIARLAVPRMADWCAVHLVRDDGAVAQIAVAHVDPAKIAWARELQERYPFDPDSDRGIAGVLRTGQSELVSNVTDEMLVAAARDAEQLAMLRRVGLTSGVIVPMIARGRTLGAISFVTAESGRRYDEHSLELTEELARRAALAIENARLYDAERGAREQAEAAQARYQTLFEDAPDAILVIDAAGQYIEVNAAACHLLGYTPDEVPALRPRQLAPDPDTAPAPFAGFDDAGEWRGESDIRRKDGTLVPVEIWSRRLDLPTGPIGISVLRDISDRRAADEIREEVLAAIAHDLRSPLGSIKLHAQSLLRLVRRGGAPPAERLEDGLAAIDAMTSRVAFLLDDIVDVARNSGMPGIPFDPEPTDLVDLAHRCAAETSAASGRDVQVHSEVEALVGMWDPRGIERVLLNLLNNAVKYSPDAAAVRLHCWREEETGTSWALLAVQDEGMGIPPPDLPRIFDRYRRGRNVGKIGGTGLGLTGAKQIVERHEGTIAVASQEGSGTTVTVRLPLNRDSVGGR